MKTSAELQQLAARIKYLRLKGGHESQEKFAFKYDIGRMQLRRYELGGNLNYSSLLKIVKGLDISLKDFFSEGFD